MGFGIDGVFAERGCGFEDGWAGGALERWVGGSQQVAVPRAELRFRAL